MSKGCICKCQSLDSDLKPYIDFLSKGILPKSQKKSRSILLQQSDYAMLFHSRVANSKRTQSIIAHYQLALQKSFIPTVLKLYHDSTLGAHGSIQDTIDKVKEHYYFSHLTVIVSDYVRSCKECQE